MSANDEARAVSATSDAALGRAFAVVDGARFGDLPALLARERLFGRSLFLGQAATGVESASPWLIDLSQNKQAPDAIVRLVGTLPAMVLWWCALGEAALFRHLRGLNMIRIPAWAADGGERPPDEAAHGMQEEGEDTAALTAVLFRHWDPEVLEQILPVLNAGQFARILGPASRLRFRAAGGNRAVVAEPAWPAPSGGLLTIASGQIEALTRRRIEASRRWIAGYLRDVAPNEVGDAGDDAVRRHVLISEVEGRKLGIQSEQGHARFALLMLMTEGRILSMSDQLRFISKGPRTPDYQVARLIDVTIDAMRGSRSGAGLNPQPSSVSVLP